MVAGAMACLKPSFLASAMRWSGRKTRANFPAEADLAKDDVIFGELAAGDGGSNGEADSEIGGGILELHAADYVDENIFVAQGELGAALQHGE